MVRMVRSLADRTFQLWYGPSAPIIEFMGKHRDALVNTFPFSVICEHHMIHHQHRQANYAFNFLGADAVFGYQCVRDPANPGRSVPLGQYVAERLRWLLGRQERLGKTDTAIVAE